jgi:hypothetical protein
VLFEPFVIELLTHSKRCTTAFNVKAIQPTAGFGHLATGVMQRIARNGLHTRRALFACPNAVQPADPAGSPGHDDQKPGQRDAVLVSVAKRGEKAGVVVCKNHSRISMNSATVGVAHDSFVY